jgi:hypothetical protein
VTETIGEASGPILRPEKPSERPTSRLAAVARVARGDMVELGLLSVLLAVALGVIASILLRYSSVRRETARLEEAIARAGNVEGNLTAREKQIALLSTELVRLQARVPDTLILKALDARLDFLPGRHHLTPLGMAPWGESRVTILAGALGSIDATRLERSIDVRGKFQDVLALLAELEGWVELVTIKDLLVRPPPGLPRGEVVAHLEIAFHRVAKKEESK